MFDDIVKLISNCSQCKSDSQFPKQLSDVSVWLSMFLLEPTGSTDRTKKKRKVVQNCYQLDICNNKRIKLVLWNG